MKRRVDRDIIRATNRNLEDVDNEKEIESKDINLAIEEICSLLQLISPEKVVWDIEDLSKQPPWGANISEEITDLSNYFVTSSGEDLIILLKHALDKSKELKVSLKIDTL